MTTFDLWISWLLDREGGYNVNPKDPGGETNFGIAKRYHPGVDIKNLTREKAIEIYRAEYWGALKCDLLPPAVAFLLADAGVNQGVGIAARLLQAALRVTVDGMIGPVTLAAAAKADQSKLLVEIAAHRMVLYASDPNEDSFELGWARRLMACLVEATKILH